MMLWIPNKICTASPDTKHYDFLYISITASGVIVCLRVIDSFNWIMRLVSSSAWTREQEYVLQYRYVRWTILNIEQCLHKHDCVVCMYIVQWPKTCKWTKRQTKARNLYTCFVFCLFIQFNEYFWFARRHQVIYLNSRRRVMPQFFAFASLKCNKLTRVPSSGCWAS